MPIRPPELLGRAPPWGKGEMLKANRWLQVFSLCAFLCWSAAALSIVFPSQLPRTSLFGGRFGQDPSVHHATASSRSHFTDAGTFSRVVLTGRTCRIAQWPLGSHGFTG